MKEGERGRGKEGNLRKGVPKGRKEGLGGGGGGGGKRRRSKS